MSEFGTYLRKLRENRKMSINQLALYSGVSAPQISRVETGSRGVPKPETIKKLALALNVDYENLMQVAGYTNATKSPFKNLKDFIKNISLNENEFLDKIKPDIDNILDKLQETHNIKIDPTPKDILNFCKNNESITLEILNELEQIPTKPYYMLTKKDEKDIAERLQQMMDDLESDSSLAFMGEPMNEEDRELLRISLENTLRMSKQMVKKKFTPKKYRK